MHRVRRRASYLIIPKGKRLAEKVVEKLERENYHYVIAKAVDAAKRQEEKKNKRKSRKQSQSEQSNSRKSVPVIKINRQERIQRLGKREERRRKRKEAAIRDELRRKKYRVHPDDMYHVYLEGYTKKRHRITKKRFMQCVDVPLFKEVLFHNKELLESPIWDDNLDLRNLTFARARVLKDHLQQFEVLVEALKQGIFNIKGSDDLPVAKVRRRLKVEKKGTRERANSEDISLKRTSSDKPALEGTSNKSSKKVRDKYKPKAKYQMKESKGKGSVKSKDPPKPNRLKRRLTYPPFVEDPTLKMKLPVKVVPWWEKIDSWLHQPVIAPKEEKKAEEEKELPQEEGSVKEREDSKTSLQVGPVEVVGEKENLKDNPEVEPTTQNYARRKSVVIFDSSTNRNKAATATDITGQPLNNRMRERRMSQGEISESVESSLFTFDGQPFQAEKRVEGQLGRETIRGSVRDIKRLRRMKQNQQQFGKYFTLTVPYNLGKKQKFLHNLIEKRKKNANKGNAAAMHKKKNDKRPQHVPKYDPLQRLHEDEKESDVWTMTTTTTTNGYASWRRPPHVDKRKLDEEDDWTESDRTFICRIVLLLIVMWEASYFVEKQLDNVYYNVFTSHLNRENIWPLRPGLFPLQETYFVVHAQEWIHFIVSVISMSIIHKENECVSLVFAFSLLYDGVYKVALATNDSLFLPHTVSWASVGLNAAHIVWKALIISLFVAYHFYSADYIRKAREFSHRKTKLNNHEINAKGIKGLQKRKLAWDWMVHHARRTNLRAFRNKYPNVKDGNYPPEDLAKEIKFDESKELRLYAQEHNLNIGYPYNKLRDMKRYVFGELEKSDYSSLDEERRINQERAAERRRSRTHQGLTMEKYDEWRANNKTIKRKPSQIESLKPDPKAAARRAAKAGIKPPPRVAPSGGYSLTYQTKGGLSSSVTNILKEFS